MNSGCIRTFWSFGHFRPRSFPWPWDLKFASEGGHPRDKCNATFMERGGVAVFWKTWDIPLAEVPPFWFVGGMITRSVNLSIKFRTFRAAKRFCGIGRTSKKKGPETDGVIEMLIEQAHHPGAGQVNRCQITMRKSDLQGGERSENQINISAPAIVPSPSVIWDHCNSSFERPEGPIPRSCHCSIVA